MKTSLNSHPVIGPNQELPSLDQANFSQGFHRTSWGSYEHLELRNGLNAHLLHFPGSKSLYVQAVVKAGARSDDPSAPGIAHFAEHMKFCGPDETSRTHELAQHRIRDCAFTGHGFTCFQAEGPAQKAEMIFNSLLNLCTRNSFDQDFIYREKKVVQAELMEQMQRPAEHYASNLALTELNSALCSPWHTLGTVQSITEFTEEKLTRFIKKAYRPDNMELVIVGNLCASGTDMKTEIARTFSAIPRPAEPLERQKPLVFPQIDRTLDVRHFDVPGVFLHLCAPFAVNSPVAEAASTILMNALVSGRDSLIFRHLRSEEGLIYSARGQAVELASNISVAEFSLTVNGAKEANRAIQVVDVVLAEVERSGLPPPIFSLVRDTTRSSIPTFERGIGDRLVRSLGTSGKVTLPDQMAEAVDRVTQEDIKALAWEWRKCHVAAAGSIRPGEIELPSLRDRPLASEGSRRIRSLIGTGLAYLGIELGTDDIQ